MKKLIIVGVSVFAVTFLLFLRSNHTPLTCVAVVDGTNIVADEFQKRYKTYIATTNNRDNIILRQRILDNMVNEELIFADVHRKKFDADDVYRNKTEEIKNQAMLDRYAKSVSVDTVSISEQELRKEFHAFNSKVAARYLYAKKEEDAQKLKDKLEHGATFDELARDVFQDPELANNGGYLGYFGWGEMEPALEDAAFSLPIGTLSGPVKLKVGYAIVKVENRVEAPLASEMDYAKNKEKLEQSIVDKKVMRFISNSAHQIEKELSPAFNDEAVTNVFQQWQYVFYPPASSGVNERTDVSQSIGSMWMVKFGLNTWTVNDFLQRVQETTPKQRKHVRSSEDVKDIAVGLAVRDVILSKARGAGLEGHPDVLSQVENAKKLYLMKRWTASVQDTVGQHGWDERMLREEYSRNTSQYMIPPEINVAEILVRWEDEANALLKELKKGTDFAEVARTHSIRLWAAKNGGNLGWGTKSKYGILGEKLFSAHIGQLVGPEFVDPYYGIFKLLDKKEGRQKSLDESRDEIIEELTFVRQQEALKDAVGQLRRHSSVHINMDVLANVDIQ